MPIFRLVGRPANRAGPGLICAPPRLPPAIEDGGAAATGLAASLGPLCEKIRTPLRIRYRHFLSKISALFCHRDF